MWIGGIHGLTIIRVGVLWHGGIGYFGDVEVGGLSVDDAVVPVFVYVSGVVISVDDLYPLVVVVMFSHGTFVVIVSVVLRVLLEHT